MFETTIDNYSSLEFLVVYDLGAALNSSLFKNFHKKFPKLKRFTFISNGEGGFDQIFDGISTNAFHIEWLIIGSITGNFRETAELAKLISNTK